MVSDPANFIDEWHRKLIDSSSDAMKAAFAAGIPMDYKSEFTPDGGLRITATTRWPCALVGNTLYYRKDEQAARAKAGGDGE